MALGRGKCQYRNMCNRGCPFGAYFSSNAVTLVAAENTGNLVVRSDAIVTELIYDPGAQKATGVRVIDRRDGTESEYFAKLIFVCASALNTAWLLLNSKSSRFPTGFGNDSDQVGRNIMDHHYGIRAVGEISGYDDKYYRGRRPVGFYIPRFRNLGDRVTHREEYLRGFGYEGAAFRPGWRRQRPGMGAARKADLSRPGPWMISLNGEGEVLPHPDNRVFLNEEVRDRRGLPTLSVRASLGENESRMRKDMLAAAAEMLEAVGAGNIQTSDEPHPMGNGIHEMGTARMGRDPKTSVLNAHNQMHACRNVYITDGAAMTSASCVHPSLTYMALTARACAHAVEAQRRGDL